MANVPHASLTGSELHEPKGAATASLGEVYVADGAGSGSWSSVGTSSFTGQIADFLAPVAPSGWLELDGSVISTSTYSALFAVMSISTSGTRTNGNPVVTSIPSTANFKAGYYVFGTGIGTGTTIVSVDSATQITLSNNASSGGTATFYVSPFLMNTGTITLPDVTLAGRFRRSRSSSTKVGDFQADQNQAHTHSGTTSVESTSHTHTYSGNTSTESAAHTHAGVYISATGSGYAGGVSPAISGLTAGDTGSQSANHTHAYSGTTSGVSHQHNHTFVTASSGSTEARPLALVVLTCIKT